MTVKAGKGGIVERFTGKSTPYMNLAQREFTFEINGKGRAISDPAFPVFIL
jgi:hypothetical protein